MNKIIIYTDGGCRGNPGIGGWGVLLKYQNKQKRLYGCEKKTTNNRMELTAVIEALKALKSSAKILNIELWTDSKYVINGITQWLAVWKQKHWRTSAKKEVKNIDLWQQLDQLITAYQIDWHWVKGHSNHNGNDIADQLANQAMDEC